MPSLRDSARRPHAYPALKRWAIIFRPAARDLSFIQQPVIPTEPDTGRNTSAFLLSSDPELQPSSCHPERSRGICGSRLRNANRSSAQSVSTTRHNHSAQPLKTATAPVILSGGAQPLRTGVEGPLSPTMPSLRDSARRPHAYPALKRWAIIFRPAARDLSFIQQPVIPTEPDTGRNTSAFLLSSRAQPRNLWSPVTEHRPTVSTTKALSS